MAASSPSLPAEMTVVAISEPGGPEVLRPELRPLPRPGSGEVLIRVATAGINRPDVLQRSGNYPAPAGASDLLGLEVAGEVVAFGEGVGRYALGDRVCALTAGGGYAEYAVAPESSALPIPDGLSMDEAGAIPETYFTVWTNVFDRGRLQAGETLLLHGGTSGIGTTAIMLAKAFGARVIATAGSDEKCRTCRTIGADVAINYRNQDFVAETKAATEGRGADLILDMVGGAYTPRNWDAAAIEGRIVQIGFQGGAKVEADFRRLVIKRLTHTGSTLRPQSVEAKAAIARALEAKVWPLLVAGHCKPHVHATFPLREASRAHAMMEAGTHIGKIVLTVA